MSIGLLIPATAVGLVVIFAIYKLDLWDVLMQSLREFNYSYFLTIVMMWILSGQMFNYMRGPPTFGGGSGLRAFIYPGSRYQYGGESFIVMLLYGSIIYGFLEMIKGRELQIELNSRSEEDSEDGDAAEDVPIDIDNQAPVRDHTTAENAIQGGLCCVSMGFFAIQYISAMKT